MLKWLYSKIMPPKPDTRVFSSTETQNDAKEAIERADAGYKHVIENGPKVEEVVEKLRDQRERDHFGYLIEQTMKGGVK